MASNEQQHNVVIMVQPINVVKDPDILNRLEKDFMDQIKEVKRGMENKQDEEHTLPIPMAPMTQTEAIENDNVDETSRKAQGKRGRKRTTKLLFEIPFSFEQPRFCLEENINLDKVLLNQFREATSERDQLQKFPVKERLQNWILEKRQRNKETKDKNTVKDCFYYHLHSKLKFRSQTEVINFLLHEELPPKGDRKKTNGIEAPKHGRKKAKRAEVEAVTTIVDNKNLGSTFFESSRCIEMSSHLPKTKMVNTMKSNYEEESNIGMGSVNKMENIVEKETRELDNKVSRDDHELNRMTSNMIGIESLNQMENIVQNETKELNNEVSRDEFYRMKKTYEGESSKIGMETVNEMENIVEKHTKKLENEVLMDELNGMNGMKNNYKGESSRTGMDAMNEMENIIDKETKELNDEVPVAQHDRMRCLEGMLMSPLEEDIYKEIEDQVIIKEYFSETGEPLI